MWSCGQLADGQQINTRVTTHWFGPHVKPGCELGVLCTFVWRSINAHHPQVVLVPFLCLRISHDDLLRLDMDQPRGWVDGGARTHIIPQNVHKVEN